MYYECVSQTLHYFWLSVGKSLSLLVAIKKGSVCDLYTSIIFVVRLRSDFPNDYRAGMTTCYSKLSPSAKINIAIACSKFRVISLTTLTFFSYIYSCCSIAASYLDHMCH